MVGMKEFFSFLLVLFCMIERNDGSTQNLKCDRVIDDMVLFDEIEYEKEEWKDWGDVKDGHKTMEELIETGKRQVRKKSRHLEKYLKKHEDHRKKNKQKKNFTQNKYEEEINCFYEMDYSGADVDENTSCSSICNKSYNLTQIRFQPFSCYMTGLIDKMLQGCCNSCQSVSDILEEDDFYDGIFEPTNSSESSSRPDIVFPVLGKRPGESFHGYYFLPVMAAPTGCYVILRPTSAELSASLAEACKNLWPLLITSLIFALISGFVAWCLERNVNTDEFPEPFHIGLFEGFWWSFISMTTVGYGDKAPKSRSARLFAIGWILAGIAVCSMFTAALTTAFEGIGKPDYSMEGKKVAVLKGRLLDASIVARHGGIIYWVEFKKLKDGIMEMFKAVEAGDCSGFLLDKMTYLNQRRDIEKIKSKVSMVEKDFGKDNLYYGALLKNVTDFEFYLSYYRNNEIQIEAAARMMINKNLAASQESYYVIDPESGYFHISIGGMAGVIGVIMIFGMIYEIKRRQRIGEFCRCK